MLVQIGDPLYELNFKNATLWNDNAWTYKTSIAMDAEHLSKLHATGGMHVLVFDGVKMGATIKLNGKTIGTATDQFLRYEFPLTAGMLQAGDNELAVTFDNSIFCDGRWMACTGGWDWAPYSTTEQEGINTFSKGIWKSVYVVEVSSAALTHVVPQVHYLGDYPTTPLQDGTHGGFGVDVRVHMWSAGKTSGTVTVTTSWGQTATSKVTLPGSNTNVTLSLKASASEIKLWWPAGLGGQPLYNVTATFTPDAAQELVSPSLSATRRLGFRMFALVTGNDTDPAYVKANKGVDGTDSLGMLWRVNGAAIFSKGANMIPMEEMEGRMSTTAHQQLVRNAVAGGMNTLRVWGGGMFLPDAWYDACDEYGIMVYHDMQYAQGGHAPKGTAIQEAELRHVIRRLSHHPSIVMWDGCNECRVIIGTNTGIYATFVMTVVASEDKSRVVWPSCPALGWTGGVDRLTSIPNGKTLTTPPTGKTIETHGPYLHGTGFPAVNGASSLKMFDAGFPMQFNEAATGPGLSNVFASEFGSSVYSSFESMAPTLDEKHWGIHAGMAGDDCHGGFQSKCVGKNPMSDRNYPCDNIIDVYFGESDFSQVGEQVFKKQLWQCMVGQALFLKQNIETRRSKNEFGIIVWQFNEIWPTGGWGSIEYGTVGYTKGQVLGGRWKPLQYWYRASIYADVMASCGAGQCYLKNDHPTPFSGTVTITSVDFATGKNTTLVSKKVSLAAGAGVTDWFTIPPVDGSKEILLSEVVRDDGTVESHHAIPFAAPKNMSLPKATVTFEAATSPNADGSVDVTITTDAFALYVTLTTLAQGYFSDNAFVMTPGSRTIQFIPVQGFQMSDLKSLRVEHAAAYM